ncbi:MAG TPA: CHASE2 domain-containing protein [Terriglobales bacterium]|nr:CHASE2 domain-containing protein [Terriglobales bacterium]
MKEGEPGRRGWWQNAGLSLLLFLLVLGISAIPGIRDSQARLNDSYFRLAPAPRQRSPVAVVLIDDESLQKFGRWPWSRSLLARLTSNLSQGGAQVIGLDILLSEPQSPAADAELANALQASGRAVIADKIGSYPDGPRWVEPLPAFFQAAGVGHGQAALDADGVCRRFPPRELALDGSRWAFAVEVARRIAPQRTTAFLEAYGISSSDEGSVLVARPVLAPIAFRRDGFESISAASVLQGEGIAALRGRPVLVGFGTAELGDRITTPLTGAAPSPGVMVHAQILDSILAGRILRPLPLWLRLLILLFTCGLLVWFFRRRRGWVSLAWLPLLAVCTYGAGLLVFLWGSRILPAGQLLLAVLLAPAAVYSVDFVLVERSLTLQLAELRRWLALRAKGTQGRDTDDLSWKLELLRRLQAELGSLYELHQTLLETTQDLVAIFDEHGRLLLCNRGFAAGFGAAAQPGLCLEDARARLVPKEDAPLLPKGAGQEGEAYLDGELYLVRIVPLPATTISPAGGTVMELASLRTRVERDRARAEALGFITHELRTPLVSIQGFADLMMQYPGSPSCGQAPETIFRESKRLLALINSYLDVLRLDAGAHPIRSDVVKLEHEVRQACDILQPQAAAANVRLVFESGDSYEVMGDATLLGGAVLNLVSNAIKYGKSGTEVTVRCRREGDEMVLSVHNQGEPVPVQELPRLFDVYYRGSAAPAGTPGWGLGLAFVKRIAEKHGGSVRVESRAEGTLFEIHLTARTEAALAKGTA